MVLVTDTLDHYSLYSLILKYLLLMFIFSIISLMSGNQYVTDINTLLHIALHIPCIQAVKHIRNMHIHAQMETDLHVKMVKIF